MAPTTLQTQTSRVRISEGGRLDFRKFDYLKAKGSISEMKYTKTLNSKSATLQKTLVRKPLVSLWSVIRRLLNQLHNHTFSIKSSLRNNWLPDCKEPVVSIHILDYCLSNQSLLLTRFMDGKSSPKST